MTVRSPTKMAPNGPRADKGRAPTGPISRPNPNSNANSNSHANSKPTPTPTSTREIDMTLNPSLPTDLVHMDHSSPAKGPHPGHVQVACQFTLDQKLRRMLKDHGCDPAREDTYRLQGVTLIDNVREMLHLPVRTFDTACFYYHLFRLCHRDAEYNYQDAALASLFLACKVEDTIKKSKEILCAAYNIKNAEYPTTQDDKMFEQPSKIIIGLERLILETIGFDFRSRYVQQYIVKAIRTIFGPRATRDFFAVAYDMAIDLHKTFTPIKQTTWTMALAVVELAVLITGDGAGPGTAALRQVKPSDWHTTRADVVETMLDLLDLYTQNNKATRAGARFDMKHFIDVKIDINNEIDDTSRANRLRRYSVWCDRCTNEGSQTHSHHHTPPGAGGAAFNLAVTPCFTPSFAANNANANASIAATTPGSGPGSATSPALNLAAKRGTRSHEGTMRFVFDIELAGAEKRAVDSYLHEDYEEVALEVLENIPEAERQQPQPQQQQRQQPRDRRSEGGGGGWGGHPYSRGHRDRRKGRGYY